MPAVNEAIAYCEAQLAKKDGELCSDEEDRAFVPLQELNKAKSAMAALNQKKVEIDQSDESCFFFYQAASGENIFLHPLNL